MPRIEEVPHSPLGPSSFSRVQACPSSAILGAGLEPVPASPYAAEGTVAHTVFATCMREGLLALELVGETFEIGEHAITVDHEMADGVQMALNHVQAHANGMPVEVEVRLELPGTPVFGWADAVVADKVFDLKYGVGIEVPADEPQLGLYGLMALLRRMTEPALAQGPEDEVLVRTAVIQPRSLVQKIKPHLWTRGDLWALYSGLLRLLSEVQSRRLRYQTGAHCRFCAAAPVCPKLTAVAQDAIMAGIIEDPELQISAADLDERVAMLPALKLYSDRLKALAQAYLERGGSLQSVKLVQKRAQRAWKDEEEAAAWLHGHGVEPYAPAQLLSPAQAEKELAPALRASMNEDLVEKISSGLTIAWPDDTRPAVRRLSEKARAVAIQDAAIGARRKALSRKQKDI
jgi:hypothetical protein